jgi:hypothetical protein
MGKDVSAKERAEQVAALMAQLQDLGAAGKADILASLVVQTDVVSAAQEKHADALKGKVTKGAGKEKRSTVNAALMAHPTIEKYVGECTGRLDTIRVKYGKARSAVDAALDILTKAQDMVDALDLEVLTADSTFTVTVLEKERVAALAIQESEPGEYYIGTGKSTLARVQFEPSGTYHRIKGKRVARMIVSADGKGFNVTHPIKKSYKAPSTAANAVALALGYASDSQNGWTFWKECKGKDCTCQALT